MLIELSSDLGVTVHTRWAAHHLWRGNALRRFTADSVKLTSSIDRRRLLAVTLTVFALGNAASALAPGYTTLMIIRLIMLAVGAVHAAGGGHRGADRLAGKARRNHCLCVCRLVACGSGRPAADHVHDQPLRWRVAYGSIGLIAALGVVLLVWRLPAGLLGSRVDLRTWTDVARNRAIVVLLAITTLLMSGQFAVFTYMGPLLAKLTHVGPDAVGLAFAIYGVCGFIGIAFASRIVDSWGSYRTSVLCISLVLTGVIGWALSAGAYPMMAASVAVWGLGFASSNSMQQVRLVSAAPALASASVSLNTSVLYIGQAIGSAIGGLLYAREFLHGIGYAGMAFVVLALATAISTQRLARAPA